MSDPDDWHGTIPSSQLKNLSKPQMVVLGLVCFLILAGIHKYLSSRSSYSPPTSNQTSPLENPSSPVALPATDASPLPTPSLTQRRDALKISYKLVMSASHTHLNYIEASLTKNKQGWALWADHPYFGRYTLSIGGTAKVIEKWINNNRDELTATGINRVGVRDSEGDGVSYFDLN